MSLGFKITLVIIGAVGLSAILILGSPLRSRLNLEVIRIRSRFHHEQDVGTARELCSKMIKWSQGKDSMTCATNESFLATLSQSECEFLRSHGAKVSLQTNVGYVLILSTEPLGTMYCSPKGGIMTIFD